MRIPKFDDKDYTKCFSCGKEYTYISKKCLHKLCDKCYNKKFQIKGTRISCPYCKEGNELFELSQEDFSKEPPLRNHFDEDLKIRNRIIQSIYKRKENFANNEDYNLYLEFFENCVLRNNEKDIEKKYQQTKNERERNDEERLKEIKDLERKLKDNSPTHYNASKFCFILDNDEIKIEEPSEPKPPINSEPIRPIEEKITFIEDLDKEKETGGYDINKIKEFFIAFSRSGFVFNRNKKL